MNLDINWQLFTSLALNMNFLKKRFDPYLLDDAMRFQ
jgi:hypothetical protein